MLCKIVVVFPSRLFEDFYACESLEEAFVELRIHSFLISSGTIFAFTPILHASKICNLFPPKQETKVKVENITSYYFYVLVAV